jgi:hypothetical protein
MTANNVLWGLAGAAVAFVILRRRRQRAENVAAAAGSEATALVAAGADDGPDAELAAVKPCCSACAHKTGQSPPIIAPAPSTVTLTSPAPTRTPSKPATRPGPPIIVRPTTSLRGVQGSTGAKLPTAASVLAHRWFS